VFIGTTAGERQLIKGRDWDAVAKVLAELKSGPAKQLTKITVAGTGDVSYGEVARAIETAHTQGFDEWRLTTVNSLPVRFKE
jgi:biopolymer transport protein ExbD